MLTEKECRNALSDLKNKIKDILGEESEDIECVNILNQLIDEHFENQPLKFDELKKGMWVWDNKSKEWCFLIQVQHEILKVCGIDYETYIKYEPNRFYRKEVVQE